MSVELLLIVALWGVWFMMTINAYSKLDSLKRENETLKKQLGKRKQRRRIKHF